MGSGARRTCWQQQARPAVSAAAHTLQNELFSLPLTFIITQLQTTAGYHLSAAYFLHLCASGMLENALFSPLFFISTCGVKRQRRLCLSDPNPVQTTPMGTGRVARSG